MAEMRRLEADPHDYLQVMKTLAEVAATPGQAPGENSQAFIGMVLYNQLHELNTTLLRIEDTLDRATEDPLHDNKPRR